MRQYSFLHAFYLSFYSKWLYRDVAMNWKGFGWRYLIVIVVLAALGVTSIGMYHLSHLRFTTEPMEMTADSSLADRVSALINGMVQKMPVITLRDGKATTTEKQPYSITYPDSDVVVVVVDTNRIEASFGNQPETVRMMITQQNLLLREDFGSDTVVLPLADIMQGTVIDQPQWLALLEATRDMLMSGMMMIFFPSLAAIWLVLLVLRCLLYGLIGMLFAEMLKVKGLAYQDMVRLAIIASIPMTVFYVIRLAIPGLYTVPMLGVISFLVGLGYLYFALYSNTLSKKEKQDVA